MHQLFQVDTNYLHTLFLRLTRKCEWFWEHWSYCRIWWSRVNPGSIAGSLAISFPCHQILLRTNRSTEHNGLMSVLGSSRNGNSWRHRILENPKLIVTFWLCILPGNSDSPRKSVDCQCLCVCVSILLYVPPHVENGSSYIYPSASLLCLHPGGWKHGWLKCMSVAVL